jgi:hypothetical protein
MTGCLARALFEVSNLYSAPPEPQPFSLDVLCLFQRVELANEVFSAIAIFGCQSRSGPTGDLESLLILHSVKYSPNALMRAAVALGCP